MNKMENPKMTVVKFGAEDVIATSSYSVLGSEINQYSGSTLYDNDNLYKMTVTGGSLSTGSYNFENMGYDKDHAPYVYAWYKDTTSGWTSENQLPRDYTTLPTE